MSVAETCSGELPDFKSSTTSFKSVSPRTAACLSSADTLFVWRVVQLARHGSHQPRDAAPVALLEATEAPNRSDSTRGSLYSLVDAKHGQLIAAKALAPVPLVSPHVPCSPNACMSFPSQHFNSSKCCTSTLSPANYKKWPTKLIQMAIILSP